MLFETDKKNKLKILLLFFFKVNVYLNHYILNFHTKFQQGFVGKRTILHYLVLQL
jgi:hypothetical protein